ncbi:hypothetical protein L596_003021 [Steinernema carpocapsae]|uniref:Uncharacterized protein n=1 Tax=Steinernema carpocapsae TaxID=34508 RepID=A0A4U8URW3_STECR|nr:hypothetical protein L596_003021 [Steinernema carpocapsae]
MGAAGVLEMGNDGRRKLSRSFVRSVFSSLQQSSTALAIVDVVVAVACVLRSCDVLVLRSNDSGDGNAALVL